MLGPLAEPIAVATAAFGRVVRDRDIRNLQASWTIGVAADAAFLVVALVVAYEAGGPLAVGALGVIRMAPATLVALGVSVEERWRPEGALVGVSIVRAVAAAVACVAFASGADLIVVAVAAAVVAGAGILVRPTQVALLPALATTPEDLVAANVATGTGEGLGVFVGPIVAGFVLVLGGPAVAFGLVAVAFGVAAMAVAGVRVADAARRHGRRLRSGTPVAAGLRSLTQRPLAAIVIASFGTQSFVRGLLMTLIVVASLRLLGLGEPGVGLLNAAIGAGGFVGSMGALALAERRRLAPVFSLTLIAWGAPIAVIGLVPVDLLAIAALVVVGAANGILDVAGFTILQRTVPNEERRSVMAVLEGGAGLAVAFGSIVASVLVEIVGIAGALVATGMILPVVAAVGWPRLRTIDDLAVIPEAQARTLRGVPMFRLLPLAALEGLAREIVEVSFDEGRTLMREGEIGDRYFVLTSGRVDVTEGGRRIRTCGPGEGVGEIALIRSVPRTATVTATEPVTAYAIGAEAFLGIVLGHPGATLVADEIIVERLAAKAADGD
jgi:MFS family permease